VLTASADNTVERWSLENASSEILLQDQGIQIVGMALSGDGNWLATENSTDNFIRLWDIHNRASTPILLKNMDGILTTLAFDPVAHKLAIGNNLDNQQGLIYVWNMDDLSKASVVLRGHSDAISALAFTPNGHFLISGSADRTIRLWDMNNTSNPIRLQNHRDGISALAFSPDGKTLIAADLSETIYVWNTNIDEMINSACKVAGRNLTISQWRQYGFAETYRATCPIWPIDNLAN
jgi:WD40 repeat protein